MAKTMRASMPEAAQIRENNPNTAYERQDWPLRPIGLIYLGTLILLVITPLVLMWAYSNTVSDVSRRLLVQPPAPRLQIDPAHDLAGFRAAEDKRLTTYYWVDKQKGIVHIPIEQAIKKLAKAGIDGFPKAQP